MDLNPTFGHQELLETLSHGSRSPSTSTAATAAGKGDNHDNDFQTRMDNDPAVSAATTPFHGISQASSSSRLSAVQTSSSQQFPQHQYRQHKSTYKSSSSSTGKKSSSNSNSSNGQTRLSYGASSSHVEEAYRRLGQRLSLAAHGNGDYPLPTSVARRKVELGPSRFSGFTSYSQHYYAQQAAAAAAPALEGSPSSPHSRSAGAKVARMHYREHVAAAAAGDGAAAATTTMPASSSSAAAATLLSRTTRPYSSLIRKTTFGARDLFAQLQQQKFMADCQRTQTSTSSGGGNAADGNHQQFQAFHQQHQVSLSPQHMAFSQISLADPLPEHQLVPSSGGRPRERVSSSIFGLNSAKKGLLSAVLEGHSDSNTSASGPVPGGYSGGPGGAGGGGNFQSPHTSPSQSISTKDSHVSYAPDVGTISSMAPTAAAGSASWPSRGRCLTSPHDGVANEGLDNVHGNLIVYENDTIHIARKSIHTLRNDGADDGKGGKLRSFDYRVQRLLGQGTFAQVFECLHIPTGQVVALKVVKNKPAYTRQAAMEVDVFRALQQDGVPLSGDYMVNLLCYFMYKSHLCLAFELLGLNLYEILKRRQFRGLPLRMVRTIVTQALTGIRELAQKSIVHCDLKPENILLVSDDIVQQFVSAGDASGPKRIEKDQKLAAQETDGDMEMSEAAESSGATMTSVSSNTTRTEEESKNTSNGDDSMNNGQTSGSSSATQRVGNLQVEDTATGSETPGAAVRDRTLKLIDFGSACFEGYTAHSYIQSRFYRSPEVLVGLPYDSGIDMWSLGCVAAELFLGLPILPGVHEHDQLSRIDEMICKTPDWMLDQGSKTTKYFVKFVSRLESASTSVSSSFSPSPGPVKEGSPSPGAVHRGSPAPPMPQWRLKTVQEYVGSLSQSDIRKKGGIEKLENQPGNRYFKRRRLDDILVMHGASVQGEERDLLPAFAHFLYSLLDPDPWKRLTAFQALQHPFVTGNLNQLRAKTPDMAINSKEAGNANMQLQVFWQAPWDPAICRRKLLNVQKLREKQHAGRRGMGPRVPQGQTLGGQQGSSSEGSRRTRSSNLSSQTTSGGDSASYGRMSPPNQISSSTSTSASQPSPFAIDAPNRAAFVGHQTTGPVSASLTQLQNVETRSQFGPAIFGPTEEVHSGRSLAPFPPQPLSYNSTGAAPRDLDFAYALQRPGVVPGADVSLSFQDQQMSAPNFYGSPANVGPRSYEAPLGQTGIGAGNISNYPGGSLMSTQSAAHRDPLVPQSSQVYSQSSGAAMMAPAHYQRQTSGIASSVASSLSMQDIGNWPAGQQNVGLQGSFASQSQQGPPYDYQQPQVVVQQQQPQPPVFIAQLGHGGDFYLMTTSATGQPIILQQVSVLNQPVQAFASQRGGAQFTMQGGATQGFQTGPGSPMQQNAGYFPSGNYGPGPLQQQQHHHQYDGGQHAPPPPPQYSVPIAEQQPYREPPQQHHGQGTPTTYSHQHEPPHRQRHHGRRPGSDWRGGRSGRN